MTRSTLSMPVARGAGMRRLAERLLMLGGIVGLIGLDQDVIRWSALAAWLVEGYRAVANAVAAWLLAAFGIALPPLAVDLLMLSGVLFAAANAYSLRKWGLLSFAAALRMTWLEQVRQVSADWMFDRIPKRELTVLLYVAAYMSQAAFYVAAGVLSALLTEEADLPGRLGFGLFLWLVAGNLVISHYDEAIPQDDPDRWGQGRLRNLLVASALFLPAAILRYAAFVLFCLLGSVLLAWRWYLALAVIVVLLLALNEIWFRFGMEWPDGVPDCAILSVRAFCPAW